MRKYVAVVAGLLALGGCISSCQSDEEAVEEAENEVFAIHDEVMPKINFVMKLKKRLNRRMASIDSLKATGSAATALRSEEEREQAIRLRDDLDEADSLMMTWMNRYNGDTLTKLSSEDPLRYLSEQKDQINDVKGKVVSSIEQARAFLDKN